MTARSFKLEGKKFTTRVASIHAHYHAILLLMVKRIRMFFLPKTFSIPRGIIPKNFSSLGFAILKELGNKQTNKHTNSLTDCCFYNEISGDHIFHIR